MIPQTKKKSKLLIVWINFKLISYVKKVQKKFKEEFEKMNFKEENSKGVDINNNHGKRGYNLMVQL